MSSYLGKNEAKTVLFNLLHTMLRGFSGVHPDPVELLHTLYSRGIIPCIPLHGSLGTSGDLVQMAHMALVFTVY